MTDNEHQNQIGMAHGAEAANDAAGQGSGVPMDYHQAEERLNAIYDNAKYQAESDAANQLTDGDIKAAMTDEERHEYSTCLAIIRFWKENPNG